MSRVEALFSLKERVDSTRDQVKRKKKALSLCNRSMQIYKSETRRICIEHRNEAAIIGIEAKYADVAKETGTYDEEKPVHVFCVSALEHLNHLDGQASCGFPRDFDTQIPALRNWLIGTTLGSREVGAEQFLKAVADLEHDITVFASVTTFNYKMTPNERIQINTIVNGEIGRLSAVFVLFSNISKTSTNSFKGFHSAQNRLQKRFP